MSEHDDGVPDLVAKAVDRARELEFGYSCEHPVGPLLATLAAAVPRRGRILELGTGAGVGVAWIVSGLSGRADVTVRTVELDAALAAEVAVDLPEWVEVITGDGEALLPGLGRFDLIFADAPAGKWSGLELTLDAVRPGGMLIVDDMDLDQYANPDHRASTAAVRTTLTTDPRLVTTELPVGSGIILATRRG
ncbi:demethylmenaquinone methyltransferase/2-methoxy-6-polyprenyl-1,4-benzoquinol methylase [Saccharothrix ecbatanensis]|uniref:Demethylmenaquinone methyltransferase/2-methoxy-6-polyprenyl-1,4-benzoquinol methylase n=1 Tax=Saccharothrix ecbatanensis TaxID=1105145 RepID=A0A7W9M0E7_9PSEU|nr:class I SAM-dependent methyltransferase [Saccharothrix ecbatanensis]MBB5802693.1 demethylmenaquinone methyltransferase/2-methoxy-6-polyprenyl-1,4-benzoquinol methylase [Saccharothrix ecbatanensis]